MRTSWQHFWEKPEQNNMWRFSSRRILVQLLLNFWRISQAQTLFPLSHTICKVTPIRRTGRAPETLLSTVRGHERCLMRFKRLATIIAVALSGLQCRELPSSGESCCGNWSREQRNRVLGDSKPSIPEAPKSGRDDESQ
jgi:hypothetical protein